MLKGIFKYILLTILSSSCIIAQDTTHFSVQTKTRALLFGLKESVPVEKPVIGLVLSGGGSRGLAQIGVLKALSEAGISPDIIIGTSMGSIVGGLYASGYSIKDLKKMALDTDWDALLSPDRQTNRRELFVDQKITEDKAVFSLRLDGLKPILPTSINTGQKLSSYLNLLTLQAPVTVRTDFDDLRYSFRAVCTDLVSGEAVILRNGSLGQAMRASSSVSFLLPPVKIDSRILVDGGLVANIPVNIAHNEGSEFIIAVNTTGELHNEKDLELPWIVADQVVSIPMKLLNMDQLSKADFVFTPISSKKFSSDFSNIDLLIYEGYENAKQFTEQLKHKTDSLYKTNIDIEEFYVRNVSISEENEPSFLKYLSIYENMDSVPVSMIYFDMLKEFETGFYDSLSVNIISYNHKTELQYRYNRKPVVNTVNLRGITQLNEEDTTPITDGILGKPFIERHLEESILEILRKYNEKELALAELYDLEFDPTAGKLTLYFDEGMISRITVEGNDKTDKTVILREIPVREGSYFYYKDIERGLTNLRSTNLFNDVVLSVNRSNGRNELVITVQEKISSLLRVGFRVDNEKKAQFSLDVRDENLLGTGTELGALIYGGTRTRGYILEHKSNRIFDTYLTYKINAFYEFEDVFTYREEPSTSERRFSRSAYGEYRQVFYGATISLGTQVERFGNLIFEGKYQFDEIKNKQNQPISPYRIKLVSLKISSTIDTQDKYPYPTRGVYFSGFYETGQTILGGDIGFTNAGFEYKNYITFADDHTFSPKFMMGFADKTLPLSQQYSIGGQHMFFGMREAEYRGRQIFLTSLEYSYKLPVTIFFDAYLKFRYDLGNAWAFQDQIRFKDLKHGIGATLSFDTPIGPADFSVGRSFLVKANLPGSPVSWGDVLFYFSIGY